MKHLIKILSILLIGHSVTATQMGPWDLDKLFQTPEWKETDTASQAGMTGILYSSSPYEEQDVEVFAYYSAPEGKVPAGGWPAVVCVHGGGGTAFHEWVKAWNDHGYAAISMDLEGHFPIREKEGDRKSPRIPTPKPGPSRVGIFHDFEEPVEEQWYYHAVSQAILAHSLIRSFPEVNADKTGLTGISWGGNLTSTIMGVDNRFKFAIPVYGCGFLPDSDGNQGEAIKPGKHSEVVFDNYDGSAYFSNVTYPTFWVNGTNDKHFPMPSTQNSANATIGPVTIRYELEMRHGHYPGWEPKEIYAFADSVVKGGTPLAKIGKPKITVDGAIEVSYSSSNQIKLAKLLYTKDTTAWPVRKWIEVPADVSASSLSAAVPEGATVLYFNATDERGLMVSSQFIEITPVKESRFVQSLIPGKFILPAEEGWWTWCMAPMYDEKGKLHMFNSAIPNKGRWHQDSEVRHLVADSVEGPYRYVDTPFKSETHTYHNPQISKVGDTYVLVYLWKSESTENMAQEIGIATAKSLWGPWKESPYNPILRASGKMDGANILHASNPTFVVDEDGKYRIYYKSMTDKYLPATHREISLAISDNIEGPYENYPGNPLISYANENLDIEDPYAFRYKGMYYMIVEDRRGVKNMLEGKPLAEKDIKNGGNRPGLIYRSRDGITWERPEVAYQTNTFYFGHELARTERPHILWKNGEPEYLFLACHDDDPTAGFYLKIGDWK
ncbi:MAG: acetylxylan esterase [Puniceicoccaceae bacterium]